MKNNINCSFDFDGCLSIDTVQEFVKELIDEGINVWVISSRYSEGDNSDMLEVIKELDIPLSRVILTGRQPKYLYMEPDFFLFHLDDEPYVIQEILNTGEKTVPILRSNQNDWRAICRELIDFAKADFNIIEELSLQEQLEEAIFIEDYEKAAKLRDKIKLEK